jgi:hypothetical protein
MNNALKSVATDVATPPVISIKPPGTTAISEAESKIPKLSNGSSPSFGTKAFSKKTGSFFIYSPSHPYSKYF